MRIALLRTIPDHSLVSYAPYWFVFSISYAHRCSDRLIGIMIDAAMQEVVADHQFVAQHSSYY